MCFNCRSDRNHILEGEQIFLVGNRIGAADFGSNSDASPGAALTIARGLDSYFLWR